MYTCRKVLSSLVITVAIVLNRHLKVHKMATSIDAHNLFNVEGVVAVVTGGGTGTICGYPQMLER